MTPCPTKMALHAAVLPYEPEVIAALTRPVKSEEHLRLNPALVAPLAYTSSNWDCLSQASLSQASLLQAASPAPTNPLKMASGTPVIDYQLPQSRREWDQLPLEDKHDLLHFSAWVKSEIRYDRRPSPDLLKIARRIDAVRPQVLNRKDISTVAEEYGDEIVKAAQSEGLPAAWILGVLFQESRGDPLAMSIVGAMGPMQFMPDTATKMKVGNAFDPRQAIPGAARYLRGLLTDPFIEPFEKVENLSETERARYDACHKKYDHQFKTNPELRFKLATAAYNAGPARLRRDQGLPRIEETREYVKNVGAFRDYFAQNHFSYDRPLDQYPLPKPAPVSFPLVIREAKPAAPVKTKKTTKKRPPVIHEPSGWEMFKKKFESLLSLFSRG